MGVTRIYIVRHCEARGNIDRVFHGHTDSEISDDGKRQLECLAERFRTVKIDLIYSSPLKRTMMTAAAINKYHNLEIVRNSNLIEISGGVIEGLPWAELPIKYPEYAKSWNLEPHNFAPISGEPMESVYRRGYSTICNIAKENKDKIIAVATHGCLIRNIVCNAKGLPISKLSSVEWCDNTAVTILEFDDEFNCNIVLSGDISHLDEGLATFSKQNWWKKENIDKMLFD